MLASLACDFVRFWAFVLLRHAYNRGTPRWFSPFAVAYYSSTASRLLDVCPALSGVSILCAFIFGTSFSWTGIFNSFVDVRPFARSAPAPPSRTLLSLQHSTLTFFIPHHTYHQTLTFALSAPSMHRRAEGSRLALSVYR